MKSNPTFFGLPKQRLEKQFSEGKPILSESEAFIEANRCLYCYDAPCIKACPAGALQMQEDGVTCSINRFACASFRYPAGGCAECMRVCPAIK